MSAPSIGEDLFTTETQGDATLYRVDHNVVALAMPSPLPGINSRAWHVALFDPFDGGNASARAHDADAARELVEMFARTAARAVTR